jgi:hypothetical protein
LALKKKIGTIVEEDLIFKAKEMALAQKIPLNLLIEEALKAYFQNIEKPKERKRIAQSTKGIMKIPKETLKRIMEEEGVYEAG